MRIAAQHVHVHFHFRHSFTVENRARRTMLHFHSRPKTTALRKPAFRAHGWSHRPVLRGISKQSGRPRPVPRIGYFAPHIHAGAAFDTA
jgi:hypothetical protein